MRHGGGDDNDGERELKHVDRSLSPPCSHAASAFTRTRPSRPECSREIENVTSRSELDEKEDQPLNRKAIEPPARDSGHLGLIDPTIRPISAWVRPRFFTVAVMMRAISTFSMSSFV
jgi:hypothetical protein